MRQIGEASVNSALAPPLPRFAQIEPVGRCNLACRMCTVHERGDAVAELPIERYVELLDALPGLERLHLQGLGEPMLHPRFFDMVELAVARGIEVSANSNLTLLTEKRAARCASSGLATLSVSLDGASREVYEAIRSRASFAKVLRNLGRLVAARDALPASRLEVRLVMVLMRSNLDELPALLRLAHAQRVREVLVQRLSSDLAQPARREPRYIPIARYVDAAQLRDADIEHASRVFGQARRVAEELGIALHLPRLTATERADGSPRPPSAPQPEDETADPPRDGASCTWPWDQLYVTAAGELLPCCMVASADRGSFGNVFDDGGLVARWHGATARAWRAALASDAPPAACRGCALYRGEF